MAAGGPPRVRPPGAAGVAQASLALPGPSAPETRALLTCPRGALGDDAAYARAARSKTSLRELGCVHWHTVNAVKRWGAALFD